MEQSINHNHQGEYCPFCHSELATKRKYERKVAPTVELGIFKKTLWYNSNQAASALGISRDTLRKIRATGKIKFHIKRSNSRVEYLGADLEVYYTRKSHI